MVQKVEVVVLFRFALSCVLIFGIPFVKHVNNITNGIGHIDYVPSTGQDPVRATGHLFRKPILTAFAALMREMVEPLVPMILAASFNDSKSL